MPALSQNARLAQDNKIHFYTNALAPYMVDLFNELAVSNRRITFFFDVIVDPDRMWHIPQDRIKFSYHILESQKLKIGGKTFYFPWRVLKWCYRDKPQLIITSEFGPRTILCVLASKLFGIPIIVFSEDVFADHNRLSPIRKVTRRLLANVIDGGIVVGSRSLDYLARLGISREDIVVAPYIADTFLTKSCRRSSKTRLRKALTIDNKTFVFLYVGQMIYRKGIDLLAKAVYKASKLAPHRKILCIMVGGRLNPKDPLQETILQHPELFRVIDFQYPRELAHYYTLADCFVLPTRYDTWGLVINEAIAHGLPVIASKYAGATPDLIQHGQNGYIVDPLDIDALAEALVACILHQDATSSVVSAKEKILPQSHTRNARKISRLFAKIIDRHL